MIVNLRSKRIDVNGIRLSIREQVTLSLKHIRVQGKTN